MSNFTAVVLFWYVLFTQTKFDMSLICDWYCTYRLGSRTPLPTALQLPGNTHLRLRHFPAPTQQSELIAPTHKKKITRRAATRFRSVLVYLRLVSLKIVPPLFFFNGSSVKLHRAVKEVRHRSGAENPTTFVRADVFYYALCETVQAARLLTNVIIFFFFLLRGAAPLLWMNYSLCEMHRTCTKYKRTRNTPPHKHTICDL